MTPATKHFHLIRNGKQIGEFPETAIQLMLDSGRLEPEDLCWADGMAEWRPVAERMHEPAVRPTPASRSPWAIIGLVMVILGSLTLFALILALLIG